MTTLYNIDNALTALLEELGDKLENGEHLDDTDTERLLSLGDELDKKLVSYGYVIKNIQGDIHAIKAEIDRLNAKKMVMDKKEQWLKKTIQTVMTSHQMDKINDPVMPIRLQNSPISVAISDETALPPDYQKITITADKKALINALKKGEQITGATLVQNQHVRIG